MPTVKVRLKERSYPVIIGPDVLAELPRLVSPLARVSRIFVIYDAVLFGLHGRAISEVVSRCRKEVCELTIPVSEKAKSRTNLNRLTDYFLAERITRDDLVIACGGGVLSDLVGFAAATTLRGVRWGVISSTLLGMVDAAIGGKTGINHAEGKNLVGAFWQPSFVVCDVDLLLTLPARHLTAGIGEIVKYAGLAGGSMLTGCEKLAGRDTISGAPELTRLIAQSVRYKADIVSKDEREGRLRMILNLLHTFGHAIERALGYRGLLHGEAVLIGLLGAVELSRIRQKRRFEPLERYRNLVRSFVGRLPRKKLDEARVMKFMQSDKKRAGKHNRFIVLDRPGNPRIIESVPERLLRQAVKRMLDDYYAQGV